MPIIYKITCADGRYYYGSTTTPLSQRARSHRCEAKTKTSPLYLAMRNQEWTIELVEEVAEGMEKEVEDTYIQRHLNDEMCLNSQRSAVAEEERRETNKVRSLAWAAEHRDIANQRAKDWAAEHKEERAEYMKTYEAENKEKLVEYRKNYQEQNREELKAKKRAYYQAHKEEIKEKRKKK